jgi:hypothetical protein
MEITREQALAFIETLVGFDNGDMASKEKSPQVRTALKAVLGVNKLPNDSEAYEIVTDSTLRSGTHEKMMLLIDYLKAVVEAMERPSESERPF